MPRIDFYVLTQTGEQARQHFACRLAEKAYRLHNTVHIETASRADAERVNELLWTFRDGSFVPHHLLGAVDLDSPVTVGCESADIAPKDLLINLSDDIPAFAETFVRIAELVSSDQDSKLRSRQRFTTYRDRGHEIETHKL